MRNDRNALALVTDARLIHQEAEESFGRKQYHRTVRKCQEAVELALKGYLLLLGVDYPKVHDVSFTLRKVALEKNAATPRQIDEVSLASSRLRAARELAFYGDATGVPARDLFDANDGKEALGDCAKVLRFVERFQRRLARVKSNRIP